MKAIKRVLCLLLSFVIVLSLIGCATQSKGVADSQLKKDIEDSNFIQDCFTSEYVYESKYSYISHDIIKRQTNIEEKEDLIFCNVTAENKYFSVSFEVELEYIYYDEGGWILEKSNIINKTPTPIAAAEKDLIIENIFKHGVSYVEWYKRPSKNMPTLQEGYIDEYSSLLKERSYYGFGASTFDKENLCTLLQANYYIDEIVKTEGNFRLFFDQEQGWTFLRVGKKQNESPILEMNKAEFDYSKTLGEFGYKDYTGKMNVKYSIKQIDIENECVYFLEKFYFPKEEWIERKCDIDLLTMEVDFGDGLFYEPQKDLWIDQGIGFIKDVEYTRIK